MATPSGAELWPDPLRVQDGDPYPHIKKLIEGELEQVTSLQGAVFTGQPNAIQSVSRGLQR
jgi:hypothetical protein